MPITRRQFDLGIDKAVEQCMVRIHEFLSKSKNQAFSKGEIFSAISGEVPLKKFDRALEKLAEIRAVDVRYVKNESYYAYLENLDRVW